MATKLEEEGGGGEAVLAGPLKKDLFFAASLTNQANKSTFISGSLSPVYVLKWSSLWKKVLENCFT